MDLDLQTTKHINDFHFKHYHEYGTEGELYDRIDDHEYLRRRGIQWLDVAVLPDDSGNHYYSHFYRFFYRAGQHVPVATFTSLVSVALYGQLGHLAWSFYKYPAFRVDVHSRSSLSYFFQPYDYAYVKRIM